MKNFSCLWDTVNFSTFFLFVLLTTPQYLSAQLPEQDCNGAIQELAITDTLPSYFGYGQILEVISPLNTTCLILGEQNSVWIRFSICENDTLEFLISPYSPNDDFDWALYDITNKTCEEAIDSAYELRCNYSAVPGPTGLQFPYAVISSPAGGPNKCAALNCFIGQSLLLVVNNHSNDTAGFILSFTGNVVPCLFNGMADYEREKIEINPNPASDILSIYFSSSNFSSAQIKITDVLGRNLFSDEIKSNQRLQISTKKFSGSIIMFFCQLWHDGKLIAVKKVLIRE